MSEQNAKYHASVTQIIPLNFKGWLGLTALETVFQSKMGRLPKSWIERRERIDESKNVQTTPNRTYASAVGPCPTVGWCDGAG